MLDIHTHLYFEAFDPDRDTVIMRARAAGVHQMIVVGCDLGECAQAVALAQIHDDVYASVGIHPNEFRQNGSLPDADLGKVAAELEAFAADQKVVAIGECGLDYSQSHGGIDPETKARQMAGCSMQLALASRLGLPVIIHCRDAYADMLALMKRISRAFFCSSLLHGRHRNHASVSGFASGLVFFYR